MLIGYSIGLLIPIFIFSLLNTALLRFAAQIVVKKMPSFRIAFWISFTVSLALFISGLILRNLDASNQSLLTKSPTASISSDSPFFNLVPIMIGYLCGWFLNSTYIYDTEEKPSGYGKGFLTTFIQFIFLFVFGLLVLALFTFLRH